MDFDDFYINIIDSVLTQFENYDLVLGQDVKGGNSKYIRNHRHEYLRTVQDVDRYFGFSRDKSVFEIGAFFGVVSIALSRMGYEVTASDVVEYMSLDAQKQRFEKENVSTHYMNLQNYILDLPSESVDCIIMCEVLEHLNFNPLPLFKEINRVLRKGGLFYLALPNGAQIRNRLNLMSGRPIGIEVREFFDQLDSSHELLANGHWREYTMGEVKEMLEPLGFKRNRSYYFSLGECQDSSNLRKQLGRLFYASFPAFKENQTNLYVKEEETSITFDIPGTVHPTLRKL